MILRAAPGSGWSPAFAACQRFSAVSTAVADTRRATSMPWSSVVRLRDRRIVGRIERPVSDARDERARQQQQSPGELRRKL